MRHRTLTAVAAGSWLLAAVPAWPVTIEDCQRWMAELRSETEGAAITGDQSADERRTLLENLDGARREGQQGDRAASLGDVKSFRKRAASLADEGKVTRVEGDRLRNLSETVRRCLEQAEAPE